MLSKVSFNQPKLIRDFLRHHAAELKDSQQEIKVVFEEDLVPVTAIGTIGVHDIGTSHGDDFQVSLRLRDGTIRPMRSQSIIRLEVLPSKRLTKGEFSRQITEMESVLSQVEL